MNHRWMEIDHSEEAENAMAWLQGIGGGAASGAATGAVAGPWGALIGGAVGAGLGALSTHQQQQQQQQQARAPRRPAPRPAAPPVRSQPAAPRPSAPRPGPVAPAPVAPPPVAAPVGSPPIAAPDPVVAQGAQPANAVLDELRALLPALRTLVSAAGSMTAEPPAAAGPVSTGEFAPPSAWESAESVARMLRDSEAEDDHSRHAPPHPAAAQSATPGHPLHELRRTIAGIARARGHT